MSIYGSYWQNPRDPRAEHEKAWRRSKAAPWDTKWHALPHPARLAYLTQVKGAAKEGSQNQLTTPVDAVPAEALAELVAAGFVRVQPGSGKRVGRIVPEAATHDFSTRIRSLHRYHLLGPTNRENLAKYVKYVFYSQGEPLINRVLVKAEVQVSLRLDEALEHYVTSARWPGWALLSIDPKAGKPLLDALLKARGPVPLAGVPGLVPKAKPEEVREALEGLINHLAVFEDVDPKTLDLVVGLLPIVRERAAGAGKSRVQPPLIACEKPAEFGPAGGTAVNDLRVFLLEVAGDSPRLRQDGGIFQKDAPRFEAALPEWPGWLDKALETDTEGRVDDAYSRAKTFGFIEADSEDKQTWLRLSGKGRNWLAAGLEQQYRILYEALRSYGKKKDPHDYSYDHGDVRFLGVGLLTTPASGAGSNYYYGYQELKPERRQAQRDAIHRSLSRLSLGVYHVWQSVLDHLAFEKENPLIAGLDPAKSTIYLDQRQVPRLPEQQEQAGRRLLEAVLRRRLLPFDAFRAAVDDRGRLCVARLPRSDGYFGRDYDAGEDDRPTATRVIVQPDFSVIVIGLDPAPAAELAPFCQRTRGHLGEGAITFRITRDSVVRATSQGLSEGAILARLHKHASIQVPENVLREVREWAGWVRLVNVRQVTVVRCPNPDTTTRVLSALGRKAERLGENMVALLVPRITPAEREKLQSQGIIITKNDITLTPSRTPAAPEAPATPVPPKKRGRPRKVQ